MQVSGCESYTLKTCLTASAVAPKVEIDAAQVLYYTMHKHCIWNMSAALFQNSELVADFSESGRWFRVAADQRNNLGYGFGS